MVGDPRLTRAFAFEVLKFRWLFAFVTSESGFFNVDTGAALGVNRYNISQLGVAPKPSVNQQNSNYTNNNLNPSISLPGNVTSGNWIIVSVWVYSGTNGTMTALTCSDTHNGSYGPAVVLLNTAYDGGGVAIFAVQNSFTGSLGNITASITGSGAMITADTGMMAYEVLHLTGSVTGHHTHEIGNFTVNETGNLIVSIYGEMSTGATALTFSGTYDTPGGFNGPVAGAGRKNGQWVGTGGGDYVGCSAGFN